MKVKIRPETAADQDGVRTVNLAAFGRAIESNLVDRLRTTCSASLSLVATDGAQIIGHILFTPANFEFAKGVLTGVALGPMSVLPQFQKRGVGSALVELGIAVLNRRHSPFIVVLGHPTFYPKFGFQPSVKHGIKCPWSGLKPEVFMVLILDEKVMSGRTGMVRYVSEFNDAL